jgi:hypothetical protein
MKMKDFLKINDTLTEDENNDTIVVPGKTVIQKTKRYSYDIEEFDEDQNFYKRDSNAEYVRDLETANKNFDDMMAFTKNVSHEFFSIFPKIEAKDPSKLKEAMSASRNDATGFIIENSKNDFTLINHDRNGIKYENHITYDDYNRCFFIECTDPMAYNVIQQIPVNERFKHALRSMELGFILEFAKMTGDNCFIKMKGSDTSLRIK